MDKETKTDSQEIQKFLQSLYYSFDIEEDNKLHAYKSGWNASSKEDNRVLAYALGHYLKSMLGDYWPDMWNLMQHYYQIEGSHKTIHPFAAFAMDNIQKAIDYLNKLLAQIEGMDKE